MVGKEFAGEPYLIHGQTASQPVNSTPVIGIERRAGKEWPNKRWGGYPQLIKTLEQLGYNLFLFEGRPELQDYMSDVRHCDLIISGDTLCMHLALAYEIPAIAIFNCTSPQEIYSYNLLRKIVSPLLKEYYYKPGENQEVINSVSIDTVMEQVHDWAATGFLT
jgi:heptosyltransferase-2